MLREPPPNEEIGVACQVPLDLAILDGDAEINLSFLNEVVDDVATVIDQVEQADQVPSESMAEGLVDQALRTFPAYPFLY